MLCTRGYSDTALFVTGKGGDGADTRLGSRCVLVQGDGILAAGSTHRGKRVPIKEGIRSKRRSVKHVDTVTVCIKYTDTLHTSHGLAHVWASLEGHTRSERRSLHPEKESGGGRQVMREPCAGGPSGKVITQPPRPHHGSLPPRARGQAGLARLSVASLAFPRLLSCRSKPTS